MLMHCVGGRVGQQEGSGGCGRTSLDYEKGKLISEVPEHWKGRGAVPRDVAGCLLSALDSDHLGTLPPRLLVSD